MNFCATTIGRTKSRPLSLGFLVLTKLTPAAQIAEIRQTPQPRLAHPARWSMMRDSKRGQPRSSARARRAETLVALVKRQPKSLNRMKNNRFKYPFLLATLLIAALVFSLFTLGAVNAAQAFGLLLLGQLAITSCSRQRAALFIPGLTPEQVSEFGDIMADLGGHGALLKALPERLRKLETENDELRSQLTKMRKSGLANLGSGVRTIGGVDFVSDDCAAALTATFIIGCAKHENGLERIIPDSQKRQRVTAYAASLLGLQTKQALDGTTTPLPTVYAPQIVELVWKYGQARQFATVFPLGAGTVKLPRLKAGEDTFSFLGAGTAGMSQAIAEKRAQAELVTFTANKIGGLIRIPSELEEDTFIQIGQFLARYISRQLAKVEDTTMFLADGSGTYAGITGVGPYCVANPAYLNQLAAGKTKPTDATLGDFRALRGLVNPAVYGDEPAYYLNPSMEAMLSTFNTIGSPLIYRPANGTQQPATLDGFPIRWVGILQPYSTLAAANTFLAFFGALSYWYLGERGAPRVEVSRDVFFATDELAMRALERIDVQAMAIDAMSALQTAA